MTGPHDNPAARRITHAELLHRPGERELAKRVFELLGCRVLDRGGHFFTAFVDPEVTDYVTNVLYASEVSPEQWEFERQLDRAATGEGPLAETRSAWAADMRAHPQHSYHFGLRLPSEQALDAVLERVEAAGRDDPELAGRIGVAGVFRPGDPDAATDTMVQAFVRTDVVACGLVALGQHIELQWHLPKDA
ncbi:hypothetical protein [Yinghuangia seranimata]|uniref:hypothetical protein n=1 Tax=Yinghuangia seranimata TaxID=408067 RepID=UPI00248B312C|nr:hypothetical protein [Yinghuangia seranimata]MDI2124740.1 hypothetical protein [Yinghuangia seranimata]